MMYCIHIAQGLLVTDKCILGWWWWSNWSDLSDKDSGFYLILLFACLSFLSISLKTIKHDDWWRIIMNRKSQWNESQECLWLQWILDPDQEIIRNFLSIVNHDDDSCAFATISGNLMHLFRTRQGVFDMMVIVNTIIITIIIITTIITIIMLIVVSPNIAHHDIDKGILYEGEEDKKCAGGHEHVNCLKEEKMNMSIAWKKKKHINFAMKK